MHPFTLAFLIALIFTTLAQLWLAARHIRHVTAHRGAVPSEFAGQITSAAHQKAADYTCERTRFGMLETIVGALVLLAFTLGGGLQAISSSLTWFLQPGGYAHGIALIFTVAAIGGILDVPFGLYRTFVIESRFGFNRMTLKLYFADLAKQVLVGALLGTPLVLCVLWLMTVTGKAWWLYAWFTWVVFNLIVVMLYPALIAPMFNRFSPLEDERLKHRIEHLIARCGFRARGLYVMDSSRRTSHGNAYFTGLGTAKRIVLFDTLIDRLAPPEIEAVLAHELGHYNYHHVWKRMAFLFCASLGLLWVLGYLIGEPWFYNSLNVQSQSNAMALLLFFMVVPTFAFLLQPIMSLYSRHHEFQADAYAARHAEASDMVRALVKLYGDNAATLTPDPLHSAVYDSHPPASLRIARLQAAGS